MTIDRKQEIQRVAHAYTTEYTCACMCDRMDDEKRYREKANNWVLAQCKELRITKRELQEAIWACEKQAEEEGQAFAYDPYVIRALTPIMPEPVGE